MLYHEALVHCTANIFDMSVCCSFLSITAVAHPLVHRTFSEVILRRVVKPYLESADWLLQNETLVEGVIPQLLQNHILS